MDPYGTYGSEKGISRQQPSSNASVPMSQNSLKPMGQPPTDLSTIGAGAPPAAPMGRATDSWSRTPGYSIYEKPDGKFAKSGDDEINDKVDFNWDAYLKDLDELAGMTDELYALQRGPDPTGPQVSIGAPPPDTPSRFGTGRDSFGGGGGGGGGYGGSVYQGPVFDYPELNLPGPFEFGASLDLPDYEAPEYDESEERSVREEFIQTNKGALSKGAQQAILGSANVNNPQARGQIIKAALEGFGEALGQTALKGSAEGRRAAEGKHRRDVGIYNAQFDVASKEALSGYDQSMREDLMNWELELSSAQADYQTQLNQWDKMPGDIQSQNMPGGSSKQNQRQPFMGYM